MTRCYNVSQVVISRELAPVAAREAILHIAEPDEWLDVIAVPFDAFERSAAVTATTVCAFEHLDAGDSHVACRLAACCATAFSDRRRKVASEW